MRTEVRSQDKSPLNLLSAGVLPMKKKIHIPTFLLLVSACCCGTNAADWITAPSTYTHDPQTGERVDQYSPIGPVYTFARRDYLRSGYRHTRSALQVGGSMDNMHIVEEWGRPVRPYGEWKFPFRPYSVPYSMWGPPYAGLGFPIPPFYGAFPYPQAGPHRPLSPDHPSAAPGRPHYPDGRAGYPPSETQRPPRGNQGRVNPPTDF
jgi:hypothetical protein